MVFFRSYPAKVEFRDGGDNPFLASATATWAENQTKGGGDSESARSANERLGSLVARVVGVEADKVFRVILEFL